MTDIHSNLLNSFSSDPRANSAMQHDAEIILRLTKQLREVEKQRDELLASLNRLIVSANTVDGCYTRNPGNFASALAEMKLDAKAAQELVTTMEAK